MTGILIYLIYKYIIMKIKYINNNLSNYNHWKNDTLYIITSVIKLIAGSTLKIDDKTNIGFLNGDISPVLEMNRSILILDAGSKLEAETIISYAVDINGNKQSTADNGGWIFVGTLDPLYSINFEIFNDINQPTVYRSNFKVNKIITNYLGTTEDICTKAPILELPGAGINIVSCRDDELFIKNIKILNSLIGLFLLSSYIKLNKLIIINKNNGNGVSFVSSTLTIQKKLNIVINNEIIINETFNGTLSVKEHGSVLLSGIIIDSTIAPPNDCIDIICTDKRIPTNEPYPNPYNVNVKNLKSNLIFYGKTL